MCDEGTPKIVWKMKLSKWELGENKCQWKRFLMK